MIVSCFLRTRNTHHPDYKLSTLDRMNIFEVRDLFLGGGAIFLSEIVEPDLCHFALAWFIIDSDLMLD